MFNERWLGLRSIAMAILIPGTVVGYIPHRILAPLELPLTSAWSLEQFLGSLAFGCGLVVLLACIWEFAHYGRGTLAPFDETKRLVVEGLYRYVRNPMYVGVVLTLLGESIFFRSGRLLLWAGIFFGVTNFFVMGYEEPRLRARFGAQYERYCRKVGRWLPGRVFRGDQ